MGSISEMFAMGGAATYLAFGCGGLGIVIGLIALGATLSSKPAVGLGAGAGALAIGALTMLIGIGGYVIGMRAVSEVVDSGVVEPALESQIEEQGRMEAMQNIYCGAIGSAVPLLLGGLAVAISLSKRKAAASPRG